ncbi:Eukaryotic translation initiation factor 5A-1 [Triticum urartu]|uniref:Eukaryotic translation initiation factor 5A-1 n=1 Tax=Triticum urartu TaxID=4572 RepID=M7ZIN5_TRIUA|nr:Eukaryotic translation initiation factor 5A-1 [Triticum urartu]
MATPGPGGSSEMSDTDEHHFESKADSGASKTYPQQAGAIRKGGHIVIKARPCKIKTGFADGKDLILSVMSAMGEEQICAVKEIGGGKNDIPYSLFHDGHQVGDRWGLDFPLIGFKPNQIIICCDPQGGDAIQ